VAFFAVLRDEEQSLDFSVKACHINLWSLAALGGRRRLLLDVGLRLVAGDEPIDRLSIAIPLATSAIKDISHTVLERRTASLVFDEDVTFPRQNVIHYRQEDLEVRGIQESRSEPDEGRAARDFSLWNVRLDGNVEPRREVYLRIRFSVVGHGSTWQWQRFLFVAKNGALIDFRIADIRSSITVRDGTALISRVVPIEWLAFFVIVPRWLRERATNPPPTYVRILEGPVWRPYLNRKPELLKRSKLIVYYWRREGQISMARPFRVFLDLAREPGYTPLGSQLSTVALLVLGTWMVFRLNVRNLVATLTFGTYHFGQRLGVWLGLTGAAGLVTFLLSRRIQTIADLARSARRLWLRLEDRFFFGAD
jgi:hypothetical protein